MYYNDDIRGLEKEDSTQLVLNECAKVDICLELKKSNIDVHVAHSLKQI